VSDAKKFSTALAQEQEIGVNGSPAPVRASQAHFGLLLGGVVVEDGVDELAGKHRRLNSVEEVDESLMPIARHARAEYPAVQTKGLGLSLVSALQRPMILSSSTSRAADSVVRALTAMGHGAATAPAAGAARACMNRRSGQMRQTATVEMGFDEGKQRVPASRGRATRHFGCQRVAAIEFRRGVPL
jgi:hypothetical protein